MTVLETNNLSKSYGPVRAVNQLSFQVEKGQILGILGPNGSGKTTLLGMVLDIIKNDSGSYQWFGGQYGNNARKNLGALLETPNFYPYKNAVDNLEVVAHIKKVKHPRIDELLQIVNLAHRKTSPFYTYSLGMKQRLGIAGAMIGDPEVLIFDEPTNGLDPQGIAEVRSTIVEIGQRGKTIIMASHILDEVEKVCSHVAIIKNGNLLAAGPVGAIISDDVQVEIAAEQLDQLKNLLRTHHHINQIEAQDEKLILFVDPEFSTAEINLLAHNNGITLTHLVAKAKSLESEFLEITSKN
ncbi:MAG: ATP-binding cassette domain-containing protein [Bacteroidota bacterium]